MSDPLTIREAVREHLARQAEAYREVLALCERQVAAIRDGDTDALMTVLNGKQAVMQRIETASASAAEALAAWEDCKGALDADARTPVEAAHEEIKETLAAVLRLEEEGREALSARTDRQGEQLKTMQRGKQMLRAYGAPKPNDGGGRFTDNRK
jgi:hypothetical protein